MKAAGCAVRHGGNRVGTVTSGGFSPTLETSIGMAYLPQELAETGTELEVDVRGRPVPVHVVERPFLRANEQAPTGNQAQKRSA